MQKEVSVKCECEDTGYIAVIDKQGEDTDYVECPTHHPAYQNAPSVDELIDHLEKRTGFSL